MMRAVLCLAGLALGSCVTSPTHHHLFTSGDSLRYQNDVTVPDTWAQASFDDNPWPVASAGRIAPLRLLAELGDPAPVWTRARFDVGARAAAFEQLTLSVSVEAPFVAYLNGARVATASGPITVPPGVLRPSGNVLALEMRPPRGSSGLDVGVVIDGAPKPVGTTPELVRGPWVLAPTPTSVTIVWETSAPAPSSLVLDGRRFDGGAGAHHVVTVSDLAPSSAYRYHVELDGGAVPSPSEEAQAMTAPAAGTSERVRFVVYGDNRSDGDAHRRVVSAIAAEGADFLLNTGDLVDHDADDEWQTFFDIEHSLLSSTPLWAAPGNHEGGSNRWADLFPVGDRGRFAGRAYSADYGPVHVVALDSNGDLAEQSRWLDGDLAAARARGMRHLFVFMHDGPFSGASGFGAHGSNLTAQRFVVPVAKRHGVSALFGGHDHIYERGRSDDLTYFVTGGGGAPLRGAGRISETQVSKSLFHYLVVDIAGGRVQITAKDTTGAPFDEVTVIR